MARRKTPKRKKPIATKDLTVKDPKVVRGGRVSLGDIVIDKPKDKSSP
jgi:hypothetical protein